MTLSVCVCHVCVVSPGWMRCSDQSTRQLFSHSQCVQLYSTCVHTTWAQHEYEYQVEERGYEHSSEGYSEHGGSYGGGYDAGYKVQPKKPGPYGYATPNFKCEKTSETLYVTKTEMTYDKKCYNVYKVQCTDGYDEGKVGR